MLQQGSACYGRFWRKSLLGSSLFDILMGQISNNVAAETNGLLVFAISHFSEHMLHKTIALGGDVPTCHAVLWQV